jgi:plastocyanin
MVFSSNGVYVISDALHAGRIVMRVVVGASTNTTSTTVTVPPGSSSVIDASWGYLVSGSQLSIGYGYSVRWWLNLDGSAHSITCYNQREETVVSTGLLSAGSQYTFAFSEAGRYACVGEDSGFSMFVYVRNSSEWSQSASGSANVTISAFGFSTNGQQLSIAGNGTVRWVLSADTSSHVIVCVNSSGSVVSSSGVLAAGSSFDMVFSSNGVYVISDALHAGRIVMRVVVGASLNASAMSTSQAPSSSTSTPSPTTYPKELSIPWGKSASASVMYVQVGGTVTWMMNLDDNVYTITSPIVNGLRTLNSGLLFPGDTYTYTFMQPGSYTFTSRSDPTVFGTVVVVAPASTETSAATSTATASASTTSEVSPTLSASSGDGGSSVGLQLGLN